MENYSDPYEEELFYGYTAEEMVEMQVLMQRWDRATYHTLPTSIVKHAKKHGFSGEYLRYLRKAAHFNKKFAQKSFYLMALPAGIKAMSF